MKINTIVIWISLIFLFFISAISFTLSYFSLAGVSEKYLYAYLDIPVLKYIWPLMFDLSITVLMLSALSNKLKNKPQLIELSFVILFTFLTVIFNVLHAPSVFWSQLISAMPPIILAITFKIFLNQLDLQPEEQLDLSEFRPDKRARIQYILNQYQKGDELIPKDIAEKQGVSVQTIGNYMTELKDLGYLNGKRM